MQSTRGYARQHAENPRFVFGTGKFGDLAGFSSAIVLAMIAFLMAYGAVTRLIAPAPIAFREAIAVACLGLLVNLASASLLRDDHHEHGGHHQPKLEQDAEHRDHNIRAAYVHVLADAATSIMAIIGLAMGWALGWVWMDSTIRIVGVCVIASWSYGLAHSTGAVPLDAAPTAELAAGVRRLLELDGDRIIATRGRTVARGRHSGSSNGRVISFLASPSADAAAAITS